MMYEVFERDGVSVFRKTSDSGQAPRLRAQFEWLAANREFEELPRVLGFEQTDGGSARLDLRFYEDYVPFHVRAAGESGMAAGAENRETLLAILAFLRDRLHAPVAEAHTLEEARRYLEEKLFAKLDEAIALSPTVAELAGLEALSLDEEPLVPWPMLRRRFAGEIEWASLLASEKKARIHGDLTAENILVRGTKFILLDPNQENWIASASCDLGKLAQSFVGGYEFLDEARTNRVGDGFVIKAKVPAGYRELEAILREWHGKSLGLDSRLLDLHAGIHFARLLPYRIRAGKNPAPYFLTLLKILGRVF